MTEEKKDTAPAPQKKNSILKKVLKVIFYILLGLVGLNLALYLLLSIPAVQTRVVNFALGKIKPMVNTEISVDKVNIGFGSHVTLEGVYIEDQSQDTLLYTDNLNVGVNLFKLIGNKLEITSLDLENAVINVSQQHPDSVFNFQFLIDAFAGSDTTETESSSSMAISINGIHISNARLNYDVFSEPETPDTFNVSHISVRELNAKLDLASIDPAKLDARVNSLSLKEKSGLIVSNLQGNIRSKGTTFTGDGIKLLLPASQLEATGVKYNLLNDEFAVNLTTDIHPEDLLFFMPQLRSLKNNIALDVNVAGKLPFINIEQASLTYGEELVVNANGSVSSYENLGEGELRLIIDKFRITPEAISQFARIGDPEYVNPEMLGSVRYLSLKGSAEGALSDIDIKLDGWTDQGSVQLVGKASTDTTFEDIKAKATLRTQNFNLAPFVGKEVGLGKLNMYADIDLLSTKNMTVNLSGAVTSLQYQEELMKDIRFRAQYNPSIISAWVNANLPMGKVLAQGSMTQSQRPEIKFEADVKDLAVDYFYNNPQWQNPKLDVHLQGDLTGNSIDNIEGRAVIDSLVLRGDNLHFAPDPIVLESGLAKDTSRFISLKSEFLDAYINGEYSFMTLADELMNIMHNYLPSFFAENKAVRSYKNNFDVDITIKNTETLGKIFTLPVDIVQPLIVKANVNTIDNRLTMTVSAPYIRFGENSIRNTTLTIGNTPAALDIDVKTDFMQNDGSIGLNLGVTAESDTINTSLAVKNNNSGYDINGELKAAAHFEYEGNDLASYINLIPTDLKFGSLNFSTLPSTIVNRQERTTISNFGMALNNKKYFGVDGTVSALSGDSLELYFDRTQVGDILTAFDINNIKAEINGDIIVTNTLVQPELYTQGFNLADIVIFGDSLGTLYLESGWSSSQQAINFNASLRNKISNSVIEGHVSTIRDSLNIRVDLERLSLAWLEPFMSDLLNHVDGSLTAKMTVQGQIASPQANGWIGFNDTHWGLNLTNVTYQISDTIDVLPDRIGFENLIIRDNNNNTATVSALVTHENFQNMQYNLNADLRNFMILNTPTRTDSLFYGQLFASGNAKVTGNDERIDVNLNIRNDRNSNINITLPTTSEATTYESVVYINVPVQDSIQPVLTPETSTNLPLNLAMNLRVNPDITLGVIINPETGDAMQVNGSGEIRFNYDMQAENMSTYGEYILSDGSVRLRLQNVKTLEFRIRQGSKIDLVGDPMKTTFDITAYRRVRARLSTLDGSFAETYGNTRVNVDCVLGIKGSMDRMEISYDINLPDADEETQRRLQSLISTDEEKTKNFAWLVATGSFFPNNSTGTGNFGESIATSLASSALSQGLNAMLGGILGNNWQIGTEINADDGDFSNVDMNVNLSTQLFDDRLTFNTNLGYRTESQLGTNESSFVGDFDIQYQLSRLWTLKVYNKTNDNLFYRQAPTTQGIGIVYTKEASRIKDLFRSFKRRRQPQNKENKSDQSQ